MWWGSSVGESTGRKNAKVGGGKLILNVVPYDMLESKEI